MTSNVNTLLANDKPKLFNYAKTLDPPQDSSLTDWFLTAPSGRFYTGQITFSSITTTSAGDGGDDNDIRLLCDMGDRFIYLAEHTKELSAHATFTCKALGWGVGENDNGDPDGPVDMRVLVSYTEVSQ